MADPSQALVPSSRVLGFLVHSNLHIGGVAVALMLSTAVLADVPISPALLVAGACGAFLLYQFDRTRPPGPEDQINCPDRLLWVAAHPRFIRTANGVAVVGACVSVCWLKWQTVLAGSLLGFLGFVYLAKGGRGPQRLKRLWWLKPGIIASAWSMGVVLLPFLDGGGVVDASMFLLMGYRMLFLLPNVLLADWPDRAGDDAAGLTTVANQFGAKAVRMVAGMASLGAVILGGIAVAAGGDPLLWSIELVGIGLMLGMVVRPLPDSSPYFGLFLDILVMWPALGWVALFLRG